MNILQLKHDRNITVSNFAKVKCIADYNQVLDKSKINIRKYLKNLLENLLEFDKYNLYFTSKGVGCLKKINFF